MIDKLKGLQLTKKRSFWVLLAIQVAVLVFGIVNLFGHDAVYSYGIDDMQANFGSVLEGQGVYADESYGLTGNLVDFNVDYLPKGVYVVELKYDTDISYENMCTVSAELAPYNSFFTNGAPLQNGLAATDFEMWLTEDVIGVIVHAAYEKGSLLVEGLNIYETNALYRIYLFGICLACGLLSGGYLYYQYDKKYGVSSEKKKVFFGWLVITLMSSLTVMADYVISSGDVGYHLMRIEGLKDGILSGQFPVRIAPKWLENHGYASAIFYPEIMLLPAAFLRMIGFTVTTSYRIYMVILNGATAWIAYYSFSKMFKSSNLGLICSMLHTLSIYRIFKLITCGAIGEAHGIMFLPLIVYGFYKVFTEDHKAKEYKWCFLPLSIGFAGIIQSHMLTCELVGGFTILLCIILWKKVFRKETFWALVKTVIVACLLSLWFIVPFLDYMITGNFRIQNVSARTIQDRGLLLSHLFVSHPINGGGIFFNETGMVDSMPMGIGFTLLVVLLIWCYLVFVDKKELLSEGRLLKQEYVAGMILSVFSVMALVMTLSAFPWNRIHGMNKLFEVLVSSLQFPSRFLSIASIAIVALAGIIGMYFIRKGNGGLEKGFYFAAVLLTMTTGMYLLTDTLYTGSYAKIYNPAGMGYGYISGAEYLPHGTDQSQLVFGYPQAAENVEIEGYQQGSLAWDVNCYNQSSVDSYIKLPLLYYKGYEAIDADTGEKMKAYDGDNHAVCVEVPAGYSGIISVAFVSPWYWRVAEIINVLAFIGVVLMFKKDRKRVCLEKKEV